MNEEEKRKARADVDSYVDAHNLARRRGAIFRAAEMLCRIHERLDMLITFGVVWRVEYEKNNKYIRLFDCEKGGEYIRLKGGDE